jgi:hypothetical protein
MTRFSRNAHGKPVVNGKTYEMLIGTRAQVWHGTVYKTTGGLTKSDIMQNKNGRIVSKAKHNTAKKEKRLLKAGYGTKKGKFGFVKLGKTSRRGRKGKRGGGLSALSPSNYNGEGVGTSGVDLQFVAGNAS